METGITGATDIEVLSGLKDGDQIVTGTYKVIRTLRNSAKVKVDNKAPVIEDRRANNQRMATATQELARSRRELKRDGIVIRTYDLWKTYVMGDQEIHAVSGVDIEIKRGEYVAIMGPSGSGKSTLMNLIGCLDTPTRACTTQRQSGQRDERRRAGAHPQQGNRVRLPDLQSAGARHRAAQRGAAADLRGHILRRRAWRGPRRRCARWIWKRACTTSPTSFPAASGSASRWRGRW